MQVTEINRFKKLILVTKCYKKSNQDDEKHEH